MPFVIVLSYVWYIPSCTIIIIEGLAAFEIQLVVLYAR